MNPNNNSNYSYINTNYQKYNSNQTQINSTYPNSNKQPNQLIQSSPNPGLLPYHQYIAMQRQNIQQKPIPYQNIQSNQPSALLPYSAYTSTQNYNNPQMNYQNMGYNQQYAGYNGQYYQNRQFYPTPFQNNYQQQISYNSFNSQGSQINLQNSQILQNSQSSVHSLGIAINSNSNLTQSKIPSINRSQSATSLNKLEVQQVLQKKIQPQRYKKSVQLCLNKKPVQQYPQGKSSNQKYQSANKQSSQKALQQYSQQSSHYSEQQQQQQLFRKYEQKRKQYQNKSKIIKKKDIILDNPDEVRKWIQARKRNYPGIKKLNQQVKNQQDYCMNQLERSQMSKMEMKIRKKILIINGDSRSIMKKIRNIQLLKRIVQDPRILKKQRKFNKPTNDHYRSYHKQQIQPSKQSILPQKQSILQYRQLVVSQKQQTVQEFTIQNQIQQNQKLLQKQVTKPQLIDKQQGSLSQQSCQPQQIPLKRLIQQQQVGQQIQNPKQQMPQFLQIIQKPLKAQQNLNKSQQLSRFQSIKPSHISKVLDSDSIIAHLRQKQQQDKQSLNKLFDYRTNSHSYKYRIQTLQTNLKLDDIFQETTYLLQTIRYIIKDNFFQKEQNILLKQQK